MQNEVHTDQRGADQRHGVHQAALRQGGNQAGSDFAQVGCDRDGGDQEQDAHYADKDLHDLLQDFVGSKRGDQGDDADKQRRDPLGHAGDILQTGGSADLIAGLEGKAGNADGQSYQDLNKETPAAAFGLERDGSVNRVLLGNDGDAGGHFHQDDQGDAGEDDRPQQCILEFNADQRSGGYGAGADKGAGNNRSGAHVFQLLHKSLFFH